MTNILNFPSVKLDTSSGQRIKELMSSLVDEDTAKEFLFYAIIGNLAKSSYLNQLQEVFWMRTQSALEGGWDEGTVFSLNTNVRRDLVPDYAIQGHTQFLRVETEWKPQSVQSSPPPATILEDFLAYGLLVPFSPADRTMFCYAALAAALDFPGVRWVEHGRVNDEFVAVFCQQIEGLTAPMVVRITINLLPLLLDADALRFGQDQIDERSRDPE